MVNFGERLKRAMEARPGRDAVSVAALAKECKVSYQAVKKWLDTTEPKLAADSALAAAKLLDVDVVWLLTGRGPMRAEPMPDFERAMHTLADELASLPEDKRAGVKLFVGQLMDGCTDSAKVKNSIALARSVIDTKPSVAA